MEKKQFKAESQRLMDLMINSIYTHKEIFLREIISNASDAIDKLAYRALTDEKVGLNREDFKIVVVPDKEARTLTVADNGIGMTQEEMENNLGTIAKSGSLQFKKETENADDAELDIIGQFGVGFYSAFMVADKVTVISKAYGGETAWKWESEGVDGYTIEPCQKDTVGTDVIMSIKANTEEENYDEYLAPYSLSNLIKKYSDYIRYPIRMEMEHSRQKPKPEDAGEDYKPEYEQVKEWETINSMVPIWQRPKSQVTKEEYNDFYKSKFGDWQDPILSIHVAAEGNFEYKALLYVPGQVPMNYFSTDFKKGLQLYSSGVMIMDKCPDLLPDHFSFVQGIVDTPDVSLNISREMLQHDRQLKVIANNIEKKIKSELVKLMKDDREKYQQFWTAFGMQFKYALMNAYGQNRDTIRDLLLFWSSKENKLTSLKEYVDRMPESQEKIYYVCADSVEHASKMPQAERVLKAGYEVLYLTVDEDEIVLQMLENAYDKPFVSVASEDALPVTDAEKATVEQAEKDHKALLDFAQETLKGEVSKVRISKILQSGAVCLTAEGPVSLEMEKYFRKMRRDFPMSAQRVLELNPDAPAFQALCKAYEEDKEKAAAYVEVLYNQALIIADLPLPDPAWYAELVCGLMK
ncbi:MAG: molecular chaperone HtpG [Evtepia gabavorous]|uniref:molecular chaperone HtpG n=1 Tax=Evtepia gabavorous TaxID=2211183 RepID=UPI00033F6C0B|nr:molecular chaperone HtpG [Evtepia gabavorous]MEE0065679.1 molecular chaperone HtpG [Evtepia gabavorous]CCY26222.1 chaperone protein HtpG [Firmicutes bacterium CAG:114]